jgi:hypothetical protein
MMAAARNTRAYSKAASKSDQCADGGMLASSRTSMTVALDLEHILFSRGHDPGRDLFGHPGVEEVLSPACNSARDCQSCQSWASIAVPIAHRHTRIRMERLILRKKAEHSEKCPARLFLLGT